MEEKEFCTGTRRTLRKRPVRKRNGRYFYRDAWYVLRQSHINALETARQEPKAPVILQCWEPVIILHYEEEE